jgi:glycosyltransferase involved in cell wall biosynthesis
MSETIQQILGDDAMRSSMKESGLRRSEQFLWKKAAEDTLDIFHELAKQ